MKHIVLSFLFVLLALTLFPDLTQAQGLPVDGKDFFIGYVYPSFNKNPDNGGGRSTAGFFNVFALISSYEDNNQVKIAYFDGNGAEIASTTIRIGAHLAQQVALNRLAMQMSEPGDMPEFKACHITSQKPVNVQYFSTGACSGGSYLAIPTPALGKTYVIPSYNDNNGQGAATNSGSTGENAGGFFLIVAPFDGTNVTITPNGKTAGGHAGAFGTNPQPYSVTLRRGQCYWVKGDGSNTDNDMSGSTVISDKPVAVLAGHEDAFLGDVGQRFLDARDFMIEQVIPAEYWDSTGYVSIPLKDAQPIDETQPGFGENYRVYTDNPTGAKVVMDNSCVSGDIDFTTSRYAYPTPEKFNVGCPIELHSLDGHKFGVMMYDLRGQGNVAPYPAESMMSIVPMSRWRTSYLFYVAANTFEVLQNYYINLIGLKSDIDKGFIQFSFNASALQKLTALQSQGAYTNIPNHTELKGVRYAVHPGAYYITNTRLKPLADTGVYTAPSDQVGADTSVLHGAFMVYHYGMRALDPDRDLGDFCGDDFFFSYALPIGMTVSSGRGNPQAHVDTLCSSWHVCVHDSVAIKSVSLIDDPSGNVYRPGKKFVNAHFDPLLDPENKGEIDFEGQDTSVCFDVIVSNPLDTSYAPLVISDAKGTPLFIDLRYKAPQFALREVGRTYNSISDSLIKVDTVLYPPTKVGDQVCSTLVYINTGAAGSKPFTITSADLKKKDGNFTLGTITPSLPAKLNSHDTLKVQVCFNAKDTLKHDDSLIVQTDCFTAPLPTVGKGGTPLIYATDIDFGSVVLGSQSCRPLTVTNVGSLPFNLTKGILHNTTQFFLDPGSASILPIILPPGRSINLTYCYKPTQVGPPNADSTSIDWITDIAEPYTSQVKSWSFLKGNGIKAGVNWDRPTQLDSVICDDSVVTRVNLLNTTNATAHVTNIFFDGPDAAQYHVLTTQRGPNPGAFDMNPTDIIWVDIVFKADLTKIPTYADRHTRLVATFINSETQANDSTIINITGKVQHAILTFDPDTIDFGFVNRGILASKFVTVINVGDAPFIVNDVNFPNPPIKAISMNGKTLSLGDTIGRGDTVTLQLDGQLDTFSDTTVDYTINSTKSCSKSKASAHIAASSLKVATTDYPAPQTYVGCREHDSTITFTNLGSVTITLDHVDIVSTVATPNVSEFDLKDNAGLAVKSVTVNKTLGHLESVKIPIVYHPTVPGPVSATISYTYDSAKTQFTTTQIATGTGAQLKTTLSAAQASGQPYTALTSNIFDVPVSLATTALPADAQAWSVSFTLTYRRDVLDLMLPLNPGVAGLTIVNPNPIPKNLGNGDESIDVTVASTAGPITNLTDLVKATYRVMVAQEMATPFIVSKGVFYDKSSTPICFIATDTIPAQFVPGYQCGDSSLHSFLLGKTPTRITAISPNVITESETPVLFYSVNRADMPVKVEIFNVLGEHIRTVKNTLSQPVGDYKLPVGILGLPSGTYTVRLTTPISSETTNFIIQK